MRHALNCGKVKMGPCFLTVPFGGLPDAFRDTGEYYYPADNRQSTNYKRIVMHWIELKMILDPGDADAMANFLIECGSSGIVEDQTPDRKRAVLTAYFEKNDAFSALHEEIRTYLDGLYALKDPGIAPLPEIRIDQIPDEDWNKKWKSFFEPLKITDRIVIKPSWRKYRQKENEIIIELDPGMAFGTGTHASTSMCLQALEDICTDRPPTGDSCLLDVGTGSGILAIAGILLGISKGTAIDIDYQAVQCAIKNAGMNRVADRIDFSTRPLKNIEGVFPVVLANILPHILIDMKADLCGRLSGGGHLVLSGILQTRAQVVKDAFSDRLVFCREILKEEWSCLVFQKR